MNNNKFLIQPFIRVFFLTGCILGVIFIKRTELLLVIYFFIVLPLYVYVGQFKKHLYFLLVGVLPIFLSFVLLYIIIYKGESGNWEFLYFKITKLILYTTIIQLSLIIPAHSIITTFRRLGFKKEKLLTILGSFTVWADINNKADKILTARFSRGFVKKRTLLNKTKQLPYLLIPLIISVMRTSTERAIIWEQKDIFKLVEQYQSPKMRYPFFINAFLVVSSFSCLLTGVFYFVIK
jgi:hypothetical protein